MIGITMFFKDLVSISDRKAAFGNSEEESLL